MTTSALDSRHGSSLEWCSYGPTKTTAARRRPSRSRSRTSLSIAPVVPEPQKMTTSSSPPLTARWMMPARVLAQRRRLPAGRRRLGVRVRVQRQHAVADEVLDERQRAAGRRVVRVDEPARPERPVEDRVVADHRAADPVDQRLGGRGRSTLSVAHAGSTGVGGSGGLGVSNARAATPRRSCSMTNSVI